ncbi:hypothetical protein HYD72_00890 [Mycoplasmopsis bovis]|nr:hypothetical protein [Mycoplasmopsis bovis]QQH49241.1 hypothetical protein HYD72_00890 [Mycoplasmopsis bovis]
MKRTKKNEALVWNMFKLTQYRTNHNVMILGNGMGKSTFTKKIVSKLLYQRNIGYCEFWRTSEYIKWAYTLGG